MASSSDWISLLTDTPVQDANGAPDWIAAMGSRGGFQEGAIFGLGLSQTKPNSSAGEDLRQSVDEADALQQTFLDGEAAGRAAAQAEFDVTAGQQRDLRLAFRSLDQAAMDAFAQALSETVLSLCGQVLDASVLNADGLMERVKGAAKALGMAAEHCSLHLNPLDIEMLGKSAPQGWAIMPDANIPRGSLRLVSGDGEVHDGPDQWRRAIAEALQG
ncbi:FliH/SctL family protein [Erythrobacter sp. F6033]|uniref:FliH/SctL family protein n=1 Tax=Erythrobacter sp. F6033 TaxID=2926401 RepID=UPI001FF3640A|nr:FliH/SctL family protein [Erythrobacter sp. F6033]MCK0129423.1 flagellar assembly protein FliH [Erythrobacter sp. F6033]